MMNETPSELALSEPLPTMTDKSEPVRSAEWIPTSRTIVGSDDNDDTGDADA